MKRKVKKGNVPLASRPRPRPRRGRLAAPFLSVASIAAWGAGAGRDGPASPRAVVSQLRAPVDRARFSRSRRSSVVEPEPAKGRGALRVVRAFEGAVREAESAPCPSIAAGRDQIAIATDDVWAVCSKTGEELLGGALDAWFEDVSPPGAARGAKVAYDPHGGRWLLLAAAADEASGRSSYLLSVSEGADALGRWWAWNIDAAPGAGEPGGSDVRDLGLGFDDSHAVFVTSNHYTFEGEFRYAALRVFRKSELYWRDDGLPLSWHDFWEWTDEDGSPVFSWQPVLALDAAESGHLLDTESPSSGNGVTVWAVSKTDPPELALVGTVPVGDYESPPPAVQRGGPALVATGDCRLGNAVSRGGRMVAAFCESRDWGAGPRAAVRCVEIDPSAARAVSDIAFGHPDLFCFNPAAALDGAMNVVVAFSRSGAAEHVSARAAGRYPGQASFQTSVSLGEGTGYLAGAAVPGATGIAYDGFLCESVWACFPAATAEGTWAVGVARLSYHGCFRRGDCNADDRLDIADAMCILLHLFGDGGAMRCADAGDCNDDGELDIADAIALLGHLFAGAAPPPDPFAACGTDPTEDLLDCGRFAPCE